MTVDYLIVGGGATSGVWKSKGAGGGEVKSGTTTISVTGYTITVGGTDTDSSAFGVTANKGLVTGVSGSGKLPGADWTYASGGGGGDSANGGDPPVNSSGGDGGAGTASTIRGTTEYFGGGGGGAGLDAGGNGGLGGGGRGGRQTSTTITAGTANTGGGGGAPYGGGTVAAGGSGVVIIRYPTVFMTATGGTITTFQGYTIHTFNSSGTFTVTSDRRQRGGGMGFYMAQ